MFKNMDFKVQGGLRNGHLDNKILLENLQILKKTGLKFEIKLDITVI